MYNKIIKEGYKLKTFCIQLYPLFVAFAFANLATCYEFSLTPKLILDVFAVIYKKCGMKKLRPLMHMFPDKVENGDCLTYFSSRTINKCPFQGLLSATFSTFVCVYAFCW